MSNAGLTDVHVYKYDYIRTFYFYSPLNNA